MGGTIKVCMLQGPQGYINREEDSHPPHAERTLQSVGRRLADAGLCPDLDLRRLSKIGHGEMNWGEITLVWREYVVSAGAITRPSHIR